jgi:hypothetical protein
VLGTVAGSTGPESGRGAGAVDVGSGRAAGVRPPKSVKVRVTWTKQSVRHA